MALPDLQGPILSGLGALLEPVVRLLLKCGITYPDFAAVARGKFVQVATESFGVRGRPTNASRVAILTGLDRRVVSKLRTSRPSQRGVGQRGYMSRPTQVLSGWHRDPEFADASGTPRELPLDGHEGSFNALVRRYAPAIPPVAMLKELKSAAAVEEVDGQRVRALKRAFIPKELSETRIRLWASVLQDVASVIEHNLSQDGPAEPLFERRAHNLRVNPAAVPAFEAFLREEGQEFLERVDDWLEAHRADAQAREDAAPVRLGAGVYEIRNPKPAAVQRTRVVSARKT